MSGAAAEGAAPAHMVEAWSAEREAIEREIDQTPQAAESVRSKLFERSHALELLIIETPCIDGVAARTKARLLLWHMEMERADGLTAMRHLFAYLE